MLKQRPIAVLAEDEEMIRAVVAPMLDTLGFEVLEADSATWRHSGEPPSFTPT
jgi:CheY-like chemotaxis protein